jgi:glycosidase
MASMSLNFFHAAKQKEMKKIYDYTIDAFSDSPDFNWNLEEIKKEVKDGWSLFGVTNLEEEIVAALFFRLDSGSLLTKNTGLKINHQGAGYSHQIKEFFETKARELKAKSIKHYCRIDNFRMYSLNESHGYKKTDLKVDDEQIVEWEKPL